MLNKNIGNGALLLAGVLNFFGVLSVLGAVAMLLLALSGEGGVYFALALSCLSGAVVFWALSHTLATLEGIRESLAALLRKD